MITCKNNASLPEQLGEYVINMPSDDAGELRVLVYILSKDGDADTSDISSALGMDENDVIAAVSFWRGMGLVKVGGKALGAKKAKERAALPNSVRDTGTKTYTAAQLAAILEKPEIQSLKAFAQERLGKMLDNYDMQKIAYLVDSVLISEQMVMRIIEYCVEMDKRSMHYVEKTALAIYDEGVTSYEALEAYFEKKKRAKTNEGKVRRIMGIGERNFTSSERSHITKWFDEYECTDELIALAYDKTIASISKPSVPYMSKLLERWHKNGYKTPDDVKNEAPTSRGGAIDLDSFDEAVPAARSANAQNMAGNDLDDFFENI